MRFLLQVLIFFRFIPLQFCTTKDFALALVNSTRHQHVASKKYPVFSSNPVSHRTIPCSAGIPISWCKANWHHLNFQTSDFAKMHREIIDRAVMRQFMSRCTSIIFCDLAILHNKMHIFVKPTILKCVVFVAPRPRHFRLTKCKSKKNQNEYRKNNLYLLKGVSQRRIFIFTFYDYTCGFFQSVAFLWELQSKKTYKDLLTSLCSK